MTAFSFADIIPAMTLTVYVLRHAQAGSAPEDKQRPLTEQGLLDMAKLGSYMQKNKLLPSYCACSAAKRTRQTFVALTALLGNVPVQYDDDLYNSSTGALFSAVQNTPAEHKSMMIVAHNPGIHGLAMFLANEESKRSFVTGYAPGSLTVLELPADNWADIQPGTGVIKHFWSTR